MFHSVKTTEYFGDGVRWKGTPVAVCTPTLAAASVRGAMHRQAEQDEPCWSHFESVLAKRKNCPCIGEIIIRRLISSVEAETLFRNVGKVDLHVCILVPCQWPSDVSSLHECISLRGPTIDAVLNLEVQKFALKS